MNRLDEDWLTNFSIYRGLFTYDVGGPQFPELGNGVYLWQLEILEGSMGGMERDKTSMVVKCTCRMKKLLLDLPADACAAIQNIKGGYVVEQWSGEANLMTGGFKLDQINIDSPPIASTIDFDSLPVLTRENLAGCYEFMLNENAQLLRCVH